MKGLEVIGSYASGILEPPHTRTPSQVEVALMYTVLDLAGPFNADLGVGGWGVGGEEREQPRIFS